jgi:predicted nucleic acid-binding protein
MRVLLDTNCLVAAALPQHEHHAATTADIERRRSAGHTFVVAAHSVLESYAVLTRLPPPHRLSPADALGVLDRNWGRTETVALTGTESWRVVRRHGGAGMAGGRIYDGQIAACARKAKVDEILTWNVRHFGPASGIPALTPRPVLPA